MGSDYDRKFEEMKKYIPFLESMIQRLESTSSTSSNPRQAQLDKIRSLRDLLSDKKKRMKMENLLKCEQVLINLYAKVEQKDYISGSNASITRMDTTTSKELPDLETVRNKLKSVSKRQKVAETLPEIARASEIEEVCTSGSKEPALFQRRPNKSSLSPTKKSATQENILKSPTKSQSRRNYTRVLASPEPRHWSPNECLSEKPLFSRRSPRGSPRRYSPSYHKKERKKSFKQEPQSRKSKDLNITLNVPEESLNSLNTEDILSRIISCSDNDVDIDTLRELRTQILGELKQTGAKDDISDLILKSYKNKKSRNTTKKKKEETEEGEISDSESEAIESIYGSLVVVEKEKNISDKVKELTEKGANQARKIQICLVINSDKDNTADGDTDQEDNKNPKTDVSDFQMYGENNFNKDLGEGDKIIEKNKDKPHEDVRIDEPLQGVDVTDVENAKNIEGAESFNKDFNKLITCIDSNDVQGVDNKEDTDEFKANFYKPLKEQGNTIIDKFHYENNDCIVKADNNVNSELLNEDAHNQIKKSIEKVDYDTVPTQLNKKDVIAESSNVATATTNSANVLGTSDMDNCLEIPLLNEPMVPAKPAESDVLSEIDILKALKNEILSETIAIPGSETVTPALHQPKVTKVASAQEILPKKRISIEKYKQMSVPTSKQSFFLKDQTATSKDDCIKKQSLKLTDKECERFNLVKLSLNNEDNSDDEELNTNFSLDDIYGDLAPKSPDHDTVDIKIKSPVIIPVDPVKSTIVSCQSDIDMRNLLPMCSPNAAIISSIAPSSVINTSSSSLKIDNLPDSSKNETKQEQNQNPSDKNRKLLIDPRVNRDSNQFVENNSPNPQGLNLERIPKSTLPNNIIPNLTPNMAPSYSTSLTPSYNPNMTPSYSPSMTPSYNPSLTPSYNPKMTPIITPNARTYEMTPTHQSFEIDGPSKHKHVYAPTFPILESRESKESIPKEGPIHPQWEINETITESRRSVWDNSKVSQTRKWDKLYSRSNSIQRDIASHNSQNSDSYKYEKYHKNLRNDKYHIHKRDSYSRADCPLTPVPSFGWSDVPNTPTDTFGRLDISTTPVHPFGRSDCPPTPSNSFVRSECLPAHPFGKSECPSTPIHTFGHSECPRTPSHPFGRSDNIMTPSHPFGRPDSSHKFSKDPRLNRSNKTEYDSSPQYDERDRGYHHDRSFNRGSSFKPQNRSYSSSESLRSYENEQSVGRNDSNRYYSNERGGQNFSREHSVSRSLSKDSEGDRIFLRDRGNRRYGDKNSMSYEEVGSRRSYQSERNVGRSMPEENFSRSSRASSVGRNCIESESDKSLSVKPHAGRPFTINTSVNTTFQDLIESGKGMQVFDYSFNARRQRAASVGRSLARENSVGRIQAEKIDIRDNKNKNSRFKRASSVGRELSSSKNNRSFQDIKADLKSFNTKKLYFVNKNNYKSESDTKQILKQNDFVGSRSKKNNYGSQRDAKASKNASQLYSPKKNYRDPRMRRDQREFKNKYIYGDNRRNSRDHKNYGIVYSSDNIAKGILGSGYGVKNYKIPKLKRPPEEIEEPMSSDKIEVDNKTETNDEKECMKVKTESINVNKSKESKIEKKELEIQNEKKDKESKSVVTSTVKNKKQNSEKKLIIINDSPKRVTRSTKKNDLDKTKPSKDDVIVKARKFRKPIIYDTDTDTEINESDSTHSLKCTSKISNEPTNSVESEINKQSEEPMDSSFGIDDLEIFSDNIVTDPVIDNINALIADLDNDLDTTKNEATSNFRTDITLDKMFENITSSESNSAQPLTDDTLGNISEVIEKDLSINGKNHAGKSTNKFHNNEIKESIDLNDSQASKEKARAIPDATNEKLENVNNCKEQSSLVRKTENTEPDTINEISKAPANNEAIVSTTDIGKTITEIEDEGKLNEHVENHSNDGHHIPDSTINKNNEVTDQFSRESVPDNTYETQNETNSDVTSTHDLSEASNKDIRELCSSQKVPAIDSIGSLLSILQDRSKIKELLNMLGDQSSDNEKIKKKLEKLSEIVSDEEGSNDVILNNKKDSKEKCEVSADSGGNNQTNEIIPIMKVELDIKENTKNATEEQFLVKEKTVDSTEEQLLVKDKNSEVSIDVEYNSRSLKKAQTIGIQLEVEETIIDQTEEKVITKEEMNENYPSAECYSKPSETQITEAEKINDEIMDVIDVKLTPTKQKDIDESGMNDLKKEYTQKLEMLAKDTKTILDEEESENQEGYTEVRVQEQEIVNELSLERTTAKKLALKKSRVIKKGKGGRIAKKTTICKEKRLTRAGAREEVSIQSEKPASIKKPSRELLKLQEDIKEMFLSNDILNDTGIRMCRLAKMVDEKSANKKIDSYLQEPEPFVVIEKCKDAELEEMPEKIIRKKPGPKSKSKVLIKNTCVVADIKKDIPTTVLKYKPGPKSKTKLSHKREDVDPYAFETDSVGDTSKTKESEAEDNSSDSENDSLTSSQSFGSSEILADLKKKPKRKRRGWQVGVIKPKHKKKRDNKQSDSLMEDEVLTPQSPLTVPDFNCYTDKTYCFSKNIFTYSCRLCEYKGTDIVHHYKKQHPHSEIPLSRMNPSTAKEAIEQCEQINFQAITKIPTDKYVCRFCFKEFAKSKTVLEKFFWHVVSMHTGEYKQICSECINVTRCPFHLDIPPPPKDIKGQLIGYICGKCNYTQISLENLKTHVFVRHNDEQTEVCTINLASMSKKVMTTLSRRCQVAEAPRVLRSSRSNQSVTDMSDDRSDVTENSDRISETDSVYRRPELPLMDTTATKTTKIGLIQSKLMFENYDNARDIPNIVNLEKTKKDSVKIEQDDHVLEDQEQATHLEVSLDTKHCINDGPFVAEEAEQPSGGSDDITDYPHFKLYYTETGNKEYVCCINGNDNHYKTTLLISMKKHVQTKHSENWDGYCSLCKVIVTPQGVHRFKDCLQHFLDNHLDNFPVLEKLVEQSREKQMPETALAAIETTASSKTYINVRPLAELISKESPKATESTVTFPKIESVVSLGSLTVDPPFPSPSFPSTLTKETQPEKILKYEEVQAEIMSKKHRVVLDTMMAKNKLVKVFKCAGRFCSFTSDSAEDALLHASTHQRVGGEKALICSYCDFDTSKNAIDLVMHVFKMHSRCQYSCSQCFYRAAASQLVGAHFTRVHGGEPVVGSVLRTTATITPVVEDSANLLSREDAVPYYVCNHGEGNCKFRTYTPGKFFEHLLQRHQYATSHPCSLCCTTASSPEELINHMKSHGLKLYQCAWCIYGANSEEELLDHSSTQHPAKQPQAYLRIITNKDGSPEMRVLPLAYLNKTKVPSEDVTPCNTKENPVKEAERSIELEKLIGHTNMIIESAELLNASPIVSVIDHQPQDITGEMLCVDENNHPQVPVVGDVPPALKTLETQLDQDISRHISPVLKTETIDKTLPKGATKDVIYCLDSDEDDSRQSVIDLSDDNSLINLNNQNLTSPVFAKISLPFLYKCPIPKCNTLCKTLSGFKKHMAVCGANIASLYCPHKLCTTVVSSVADIISHYNINHLQTSLSKSPNKFFCEVCNDSFSSMASARKHARDIHKVHKLNVTSRKGKDGDIRYTVREINKEKQVRRRSDETTKRYGPKDINKLPINPILDSSVHCALCEFNTKVRLNMVRHLQLHNEQQPVPQTAPVNPVPHLETNEKHFDKMVNLASSSAVTRAPDKQLRSESNPVVSLRIPPESASRYPKYIPERQRYTCGATACSYISVDEGMFKCHWDTLHSGTNDYRCVHCPPNQHVDTSQPLSAARIIAHLKMHGVTLYGCSICSYYHCKREILEKHVTTHKGGQVLVVREEWDAQTTPSTIQLVAPTMDLKPWQCGLCKFKSMLRPEVVEHCAKMHQSKMQYKCAYCPFRTSAIENITKHQSNSHPGKPEEVFFYYYREGSIADDADGTPRWQKQRQKCGNPESEVKTESPDSSSVSQATAVTSVDLNLVKKEVNEADTFALELSIEDLCKRFGQFCEPNGLNYKCSLCKVVVEQNRETMQSHLYEELKYRKWGCRICSYKAFHKVGLHDHMASEHSRQYQEPIELPVDVNIEKWVAKLLDHQTAIIEKHHDNLSKHKLQITKVVAGPSSQNTQEIAKTSEVVDKHVAYTLEEAFGKFGAPSNMHYCCPKCNCTVKDEASMKDHLESELTKIRWCCTKCSDNFQTYHEAQFHCKSIHPGQAAQPKEAIRDPLVRNSWITNVIQTQKKIMKSTPVSSEPSTPEKTDLSDPENSLLVVRYEEKIATLEEIPINRKRPAPPPDSDDERLVIDEQDNAKKKNDLLTCSYCEFFTKYRHVLRDHTYRHFNLKPLTCMYCDFSGHRQTIAHHIERDHAGSPLRMKNTELPPATSSQFNKVRSNKKLSLEDDAGKTVCLTCEKYVPENEVDSHMHDKGKPEFAKKGCVVVKCCICLVLKLDVKSLQEHHNSCHPDSPVNYAYFKLHYDTREINNCGHCNKRFKFIRDLKTHHNAMHSALPISYTATSYSTTSTSSTTDEETEAGSKRKAGVSQLPAPKRFARKSTTKLPLNSVAKKSTTKLPVTVDSDSESETETEYSYYGTKPPALDQYADVTMLMPMCNTLVPISLKKLSGIIKIDPEILIKDVNKCAK